MHEALPVLIPLMLTNTLHNVLRLNHKGNGLKALNLQVYHSHSHLCSPLFSYSSYLFTSPVNNPPQLPLLLLLQEWKQLLSCSKKRVQFFNNTGKKIFLLFLFLILVCIQFLTLHAGNKIYLMTVIATTLLMMMTKLIILSSSSITK